MRSYQRIILAAACLLPIGTARAQSETPAPALAAPPPSHSVASAASDDPKSNSLHEGVWGLAFQIPIGGDPWLTSAVGAWYMVTPRLNAGLNLRLVIDPEATGNININANTGAASNETFVNVDFAIQPAIKYYLTTSGPLTPYFLGQLTIGVQRGAGATTTVNGNTTTGGDSAAALSVAAGFGIEVFPWRFLSLGGHVGVNIDLLRPAAQARSAGFNTLTSAMYATAYFD